MKAAPISWMAIQKADLLSHWAFNGHRATGLGSSMGPYCFRRWSADYCFGNRSRSFCSTRLAVFGWLFSSADSASVIDSRTSLSEPAPTGVGACCTTTAGGVVPASRRQESLSERKGFPPQIFSSRSLGKTLPAMAARHSFFSETNGRREHRRTARASKTWFLTVRWQAVLSESKGMLSQIAKASSRPDVSAPRARPPTQQRTKKGTSSRVMGYLQRGAHYTTTACHDGGQGGAGPAVGPIVPDRDFRARLALGCLLPWCPHRGCRGPGLPSARFAMGRQIEIIKASNTAHPETTYQPPGQQT